MFIVFQKPPCQVIHRKNINTINISNNNNKYFKNYFLFVVSSKQIQKFGVRPIIKDICGNSFKQNLS